MPQSTATNQVSGTSPNTRPMTANTSAMTPNPLRGVTGLSGGCGCAGVSSGGGAGMNRR